MPTLRAIDLFAGAGGATQGLANAGFDVIGAVELDRDAAASYRLNHPAVALKEQDIRSLDPEDLRLELGLATGELDLLKACPPCQGFSTLAKGPTDKARNDLVLDILRFVDAFTPKSILLENVPGLQRDARFGALMRRLTRRSYTFRQAIVDASRFGVPQRRKRLIVIAIRRDQVAKLNPNVFDHVPFDFDATPKTSGQALSELKMLARADDPLARARVSKPSVQARIEAVPINGTRFDLPEEHQLNCHRKVEVRNATASYGRVRLAEPAPTMTTRCTTPACGSFIHPTENRGLTLREAATFQTFPVDYDFHGGHGSIERQIGNAVPVRMAEALGLIVRSLLTSARETVG